MVFQIDRKLQEKNLPRLSRLDFDRADYQTVYDLVQDSLTQDVSEPASYVLNGLSLPLMEMADELLKQTETLDPVEERVRDDLLRALLDLRRREVSQNIGHLRFMMEDAQEKGDRLASEFNKNMLAYSKVLQLIDKALGEFTGRLASPSR